MGELLSAFADWLLRVLGEIVLYVVDVFVTFLIEMLSWVPVPDFINDVAGAWGPMVSAVGYWIAPFQLGYGVSVMIGALIARFILRRIPLIG